MDEIKLDETDEDFWYAFGRIADQYGEKETAMRIYGLAEQPRHAWMFGNHRLRFCRPKW
jgi:hypothetical protein